MTLSDSNAYSFDRILPHSSEYESTFRVNSICNAPISRLYTTDHKG